MGPIVVLDEIRKLRPRLSLGDASDQAQFTGERFLPGYRDGSIELQHVHRYSFALPFALDKVVLDIACGEGYGSHLMSQVARRITGVDIDDTTIELARKRYSGANLFFEVGSATQIPLDDHSVDLIVSFETIEHFSDHAAFWSEVKRVLRKSGTLIVSSPNSNIYNQQRDQQNPFHARELTKQELVDELSRRFAYCQLFSQSTVFGSLLVPDCAEPIPQTQISLDHATGELNWEGDELTYPYSLAIASDFPIAKAGQSLYTGPYPKDAMSAMAGGIFERDTQIRELRHQVAAAASTINELTEVIRAARQIEKEQTDRIENLTRELEDLVRAREDLTKQRDHGKMRESRLQESLSEQDSIIKALQVLVKTHGSRSTS